MNTEKTENSQEKNLVSLCSCPRSCNFLSPQKKVRIEFIEQSKAVVASVSVEFSNIPLTHPNKELLDESRELFDKAHRIAIEKTMGKIQ